MSTVPVRPWPIRLAWRQVHHHVVEPARRVLVELHVAVVGGRDLLAAVDQRGGEVRTETVDGQHLRATADGLHRQAGQATERVGDAHAGQLADLFGGDGLDDAVGVALERGGILDAAGEAVDLDRLQLFRLGLFGAGLGIGRGVVGAAGDRRRILVGRLRVGRLVRLRRGRVGRRGRTETDRCQRQGKHVTFEYHRYPLPGLHVIL